MGKEVLPRSIVLGLSVCLSPPTPPHPSSFAVLHKCSPQSWSQFSSPCAINPRDAANGKEAVLGTQEGPKKDIAAAGVTFSRQEKGGRTRSQGRVPSHWCNIY